MLSFEFDWVTSTVESLGLPVGATMLNVGSGPRHADSSMHGAVIGEALSLDVINLDFFSGPGIDKVADLCSADCWEYVSSCEPSVVLFTNVLEHLADPGACLAEMRRHLPADTYVVVTVPAEYPYHPDPIDNGIRMQASDLCATFAGYEAVRRDDLVGPPMSARLRSDPRLLVKTFLGAAFRRSARERLRYWNRNVSVGAAVFRVPGNASEVGSGSASN